jgi:hypothetical protein
VPVVVVRSGKGEKEAASPECDKSDQCVFHIFL